MWHFFKIKMPTVFGIKDYKIGNIWCEVIMIFHFFNNQYIQAIRILG